MSSALDRRSQRRQVLRVATGALLSAAVVLALYYVVPAPRSIVVGSVVCAVVFLGVVGFELRAVLGHPQPVARAAIAMAWVIPLFIVLFAWTYWAMSKSDLGTFSQPLTKSGALYFTITVVSTVGFGDITPATDPARLAVSLQMICDLLVLGIIVKLIVGVAKSARAQRTGTGGDHEEP